MSARVKKLPSYVKKRVVAGGNAPAVRSLLRECGLSTVCESARCPNRNECFSRGTATFMILGDVCTRGCSFCAVKKGVPSAPHPDEPKRVAGAALALRLRHVVITSVTRDDLELGGAEMFRDCINELRRCGRQISTEVLVPDFKGSRPAVREVLSARPDVFNHNVETVPRLYAHVRAGADYERSLRVLEMAKQIMPHVMTKSGIMVGLGENPEEILGVFEDLRAAGCDLLTIGQYLAPTREHHAVERYYSPEEFEVLGNEARSRGFKFVASGVFVRSSYCAEEAMKAAAQKARSDTDRVRR